MKRKLHLRAFQINLVLKLKYLNYNKHKTNIDMIVQNITDDGRYVTTFTVPKEDQKSG